MNQKEIDEMAEALRKQGLTWRQVNFAVSLVRNAETAERERCAKIAEELDYWPDKPIARRIREPQCP